MIKRELKKKLGGISTNQLTVTIKTNLIYFRSLISIKRVGPDDFLRSFLINNCLSVIAVYKICIRNLKRAVLEILQGSLTNASNSSSSIK